MDIYISDTKIWKLVNEIANDVEEGCNHDFKLEPKHRKQLEKQIVKQIKIALRDYVLTKDMFIDNGLIDWNKIGFKQIN